MFDFRRLRTDLLALVVFAGLAFLTISVASYHPGDAPSTLVFPSPPSVSNLAGPVGASVAYRAFHALGLGIYVLLALLVAWNFALFARQERFAHANILLGIGLCGLACCVALTRSYPGIGPTTGFGSGGYAGLAMFSLMSELLSPLGVALILLTLFCAGLLLVSDLPFVRFFLLVPAAPLLAGTKLLGSVGRPQPEKDRLFREPKPRRKPKAKPKPKPNPSPPVPESESDSVPIVDEVEQDHDDDEDVVTHRAAISSDRSIEAGSGSAIAEIVRRGRRLIRVSAPARYAGGNRPIPVGGGLPPSDLLDEAEEFPFELLSEKARAAAEILERTFDDFGLNISVVEVETGPVITQFELELEAGLRLSRVTALADDLAIALRVPSVRVVAPIPGKNTVGVEVPNEKQVMVRLREIIESTTDTADAMRIPMFLGKDVSGHPLAVDLAKMPHLLIAGRTGTGKSVCLNTLILSVLMSRSPDQVRMLMIDPKMVELSPYKRVPHLMHPVITDMKQAEAALAWAVQKMDERYTLLAKAGVRHLDGYNKLGRAKLLERFDVEDGTPEADEIPESLPYIVIVADEMADMMMTSGKDVEGHIIRLAQKSRAVGIHLVLATQKPTVDVITGLIKSNLPARISFQVASRTDSRVVLDESGADKLLGNGDMLYLAPGTSNLTRAQGTFVSDEEVNEIVDFYSDREPQYEPELANLGAESESSGAGGSIDSSRHGDDLYEQAVEIVIREGRGSVSLLQRCLGIGYGRAARLIDYMAEDGIVGDYNGSQAREVLFNQTDWEATR